MTDQSPLRTVRPVFTRRVEVSVWWVLKLVLFLGLNPLIIGASAYVVGYNPDVSFGVILSGLMFLLAVPLVGGVLYFKPEVVFDDDREK